MLMNSENLFQVSAHFTESSTNYSGDNYYHKLKSIAFNVVKIVDELHFIRHANLVRSHHLVLVSSTVVTMARQRRLREN